MKSKSLLVLFFLCSQLSLQAQLNRIGQVINSPTGYCSGIDVHISDDGNTLVVEATEIISNLGDSIFVYQLIDDLWVLDHRMEANDLDGKIGKISNLSGDGKRVVTSNHNDENDKGAVRTFNKNGDTWEQIPPTLIGDFANSSFGKSIALSKDGNHLAIRSKLNTGTEHSVSIYAWVNNNWEINNSPIIADMYEGSNLAFSNDGNKLAIIYDDNTVKVFEIQDQSSNSLGNTIDLTTEYFKITNVLLSGQENYLVIADENFGVLHPNGGQVRVFKLDNDNWLPIGNPINASSGRDFFGNSMDISDDGNRLVIGGTEYLGENGYMNIYHLENEEWIVKHEFEDEWGIGQDISITPNGKRIALGLNAYTTNQGACGVIVLDDSEIISSQNLIKEKMPFEIFPNPTTEKVVVKNKFDSSADLRISDYTGNTIFSQKIALDQTIDLSQYPSGIYFITLTTGSAHFTSRIIKL